MIDDLAQTIRATLLERVAAVPGDELAVLSSEGIDSTSLLIAAREVGKRVTVVSWTRERHRSTDHAAAQENAKRLGFPFRTVWLPTGADALLALVRELVFDFDCSKKAEIECALPQLLALRQVEIPTIAGNCADGYYGLSRKAIVAHAKETDPAGLDAFRVAYFARENPAQIKTVRAIAKRLGRVVDFPWVDARLVPAFAGRTWSELNRPRQKEPTRRAFPELATLRVGNHTNLQLGDSGIADGFRVLLDTPAAPRGAKSPVSVYNALVRERDAMRSRR